MRCIKEKRPVQAHPQTTIFCLIEKHYHLRYLVVDRFNTDGTEQSELYFSRIEILL